MEGITAELITKNLEDSHSALNLPLVNCQQLHLWNMDVLGYYHVLCSPFSLKWKVLLSIPLHRQMSFCALVAPVYIVFISLDQSFVL